MLIDMGANIHRPDINDIPALWIAIECLEVELVEFLIKQGADVLALGDEGKNVLHLAEEMEAIIMNDEEADIEEKLEAQRYIRYVLEKAVDEAQKQTIHSKAAAEH